MNDARTFILVDIDHVLSNAFHRDDMIGTTSWDEYHAASANDEVIEDIAALLSNVGGSYEIIAITARPEKWRRITQDWLVTQDINVDELLMRGNEDYRKAEEIKVDLAREFFGSDEKIKEQVSFILDDHDGVIAAFRGLGITTLHVSARRD